MNNGVTVGAVAVATPVLSFAGSWLGGWLNRRSDERRALAGMSAMAALTTPEML